MLATARKNSWGRTVRRNCAELLSFQNDVAELDFTRAADSSGEAILSVSMTSLLLALRLSALARAR